MNKPKKRIYTIDGDTVEVHRVYNEEIGRYMDDYPDFKTKPRSTPHGRLWVNVTRDDCPHADERFGDCGSCRFFRSERPGDLIGVCDNEDLMTIRKEA